MVQYKEVFRVYTRIFGPDLFETLEVSFMLSLIEHIIVEGITGYGAYFNEEV
jgi:hypothetical protein